VNPELPRSGKQERNPQESTGLQKQDWEAAETRNGAPRAECLRVRIPADEHVGTRTSEGEVSWPLLLFPTLPTALVLPSLKFIRGEHQ
jgi:hypothetical protein